MVRTGDSNGDGVENRVSFKNDVERLQQTRRVYRSAQDLTNKLETVLQHKQAYRMVFEKDAIEMRMRLRDLCERLMFLHPTDFGRKAEEILWWKVYYNVINLAKKSKKYIKSGSTLECAYRTHLLAATGFYHHLLMKLQWEYRLKDDHAMDFISFPDHDRVKDSSSDAKKEKARDWAQKACHRCLIYLGDLARYRQEFEGPSSRLLAERFYHQALLLNPAMGMPHNQLGTLAGTRYQGLDAAYHYMRCWLSELRFDGAMANLEKVFERNQKRYNELPTSPESHDLPPELQRPRDIKRFLIRFLYLQELLQPSNKASPDKLPALCQEVLQGFHQCMLHGASGHTWQANEEGREGYLSDELVFRLVALTLMSTYRLQKAGSNKTSTSVVFTLALFSYILNHLCEKLNSAIYGSMHAEQPAPASAAQAFDSDSAGGRASPANTITPTQDVESDSTVRPTNKQARKKKTQSVLKGIRRRRKRVAEGGPLTSEDSDLSEGESRSRTRGGNRSDGSSGSGEDDSEEGLVLESDSDYFMDSQELELEDQDEESSDRQTSLEEPVGKSASDDHIVVDDMSAQLITPLLGPSHTPPGRRSIRLAPSFDAYAKETDGGGARDKKKGESPVQSSKSSGSPDSGASGSQAQSSISHIPLPNLVRVLTKEGLLPIIKILTDWLRTNEEVIIQTANSSQPLWARLSSLLNLCPHEKLLLNQEWCPSTSLRQLLEGSLESRDGWFQPLPLTEDIAIWTMPPLQYLQNKMKYGIHHHLDLSPQDEAIVRVLCLRQFGYYLGGIEGISLVYADGQFSSQTPDETAGQEEEKQKQGTSSHLTGDDGRDSPSMNEERRHQVMRGMAQLRLQSEVSQLEDAIEPVESDSLSPFLIPDADVMTNQLPVIRTLVTSSRFIIIIPNAVMSQLDINKKSQPSAREAIKYMEKEFHIGNRYLRAQRDAEVMHFEDRSKLRSEDARIRTFVNISECALFFAVKGSSGVHHETTSPRPKGMVTILTDREPPSDNTVVATTIDRLLKAGVDVTMAREFLARWQSQS